MSARRGSRWMYWVFGVMVLWAGWIVGVRTPLVKRVAMLNELRARTNEKITAQCARVTAIPAMLQHLDSTQQWLNSMLTGCIETDTLIELVLQVRQIGSRHGLTDVRIDPALASILAIPRQETVPAFEGISMDTLNVSIAAQGTFAGIGAFLDDIEDRRDFKYWHSCRWQSGADDRGVNLQAQAAFLVVSRHEMVSGIAKALP